VDGAPCSGPAHRTAIRSGTALMNHPVPPLDPDAAARIASLGPPAPMRRRGLQAVRDAIESAPLPTDMPVMASIVDRAVPGPGGDIPVRIHRPERGCGDPAPAVLYFHGGGLVMGSNHSFEPLARGLAAASGAVVVAVDYRLAPEHRSEERRVGKECRSGGGRDADR